MRGDLVREHALGFSLEVATQQLLQSLHPRRADVLHKVTLTAIA
jgi:hypothetical protein